MKAIRKETKVNLTTRFLNGKMLMFPKTFVQSFVYDLIDVFMFPYDVVKEIYKKNEIQQCLLFQNLTETGILLYHHYYYFCKLSCSVDEKTARNINFEVLPISKVLNKLDLSNGFWKQFNVQNKSLKKQVGLHEVENINNTNTFMIAINSRKYFEKY